jgi:hypothetical protein
LPLPEVAWKPATPVPVDCVAAVDAMARTAAVAASATFRGARMRSSKKSVTPAARAGAAGQRGASLERRQRRKVLLILERHRHHGGSPMSSLTGTFVFKTAKVPLISGTASAHCRMHAHTGIMHAAVTGMDA